MSDGGRDTRYNFRCDSETLEAAKRNTGYGELAELGRQMLHRVAYGTDDGNTKLERARAELQAERGHLEDVRSERRRIDAEIESTESRITNLENRVERLQQEQDEIGHTVTMFENMLLDGQRVWPTWIENTAEVDSETAHRVYNELQERNGDVPHVAFEEPGIHQPTDWRKVIESDDEFAEFATESNR